MKPVGFAPLLTMMFLTDFGSARVPGFSPLSPDESRTRRALLRAVTLLVCIPSTRLITRRATATMIRLSSSAYPWRS